MFFDNFIRVIIEAYDVVSSKPSLVRPIRLRIGPFLKELQRFDAPSNVLHRSSAARARGKTFLRVIRPSLRIVRQPSRSSACPTSHFLTDFLEHQVAALVDEPKQYSIHCVAIVTVSVSWYRPAIRVPETEPTVSTTGTKVSSAELLVDTGKIVRPVIATSTFPARTL